MRRFLRNFIYEMIPLGLLRLADYNPSKMTPAQKQQLKACLVKLFHATAQSLFSETVSLESGGKVWSSGNRKMSFEVHTNESHEGRRILLLDLVWTFAYRPEGAKPASGEAYVRQIRDEEQYREFIVDHFLDKGWYIILLTARRGKFREASLESIQRKIGWSPDSSCFNDRDLAPPLCKKIALEQYIFPRFGAETSRYLALESNKLTRAMYRRMGIEAHRWEDYFVDRKNQGHDRTGILQPELFKFDNYGKEESKSEGDFAEKVSE
jgi:hypothetical protein